MTEHSPESRRHLRFHTPSWQHLSTETSRNWFRALFQIRYNTNEPVWEENFTFFIHNPKRQELEVEVIYLHVYIDVFISPHHTARRELPPWTHQPDMLLLQVLAAGQEELVFNFQLLADCSWCLELQLAFVCWRHCQPCCVCLLCSCSVDIQGTAACWLLPARALPSSLASLLPPGPEAWPSCFPVAESDAEGSFFLLLLVCCRFLSWVDVEYCQRLFYDVWDDLVVFPFEVCKYGEMQYWFSNLKFCKPILIFKI